MLPALRGVWCRSPPAWITPAASTKTVSRCAGGITKAASLQRRPAPSCSLPQDTPTPVGLRTMAVSHAGETTPPEGPFVRVAAADYLACGIRLDGGIACWGDYPRVLPAEQCSVASGCGDGIRDPEEDCDDGDRLFEPGEYCAADCTALPCGAPSGRACPDVGATDARFTLMAAVGVKSCDIRVCDVDSSDEVSASDALMILLNAVGLPVTLSCPFTVR